MKRRQNLTRTRRSPLKTTVCGADYTITRRRGAFYAYREHPSPQAVGGDYDSPASAIRDLSTTHCRRGR